MEDGVAEMEAMVRATAWALAAIFASRTARNAATLARWVSRGMAAIR